MRISSTKMPYPPLTNLFSSVEKLCAIRILPLPDWQRNWKMSKKDKPSEGSTVGGGGLLRPQWCLTPPVPADLSLCDGSDLQTGKELSRELLVHVLQGAPLVFYDVSLGWKDWRPRMGLEEDKDAAVTSDLWGCWVLTVANGPAPLITHSCGSAHSSLMSLFSDCSNSLWLFSTFFFSQSLCLFSV